MPDHRYKPKFLDGSKLPVPMANVSDPLGVSTRPVERGGSSYFIPSGVVHSVQIPAGTKVIDFFEEKERYRLK